MPYVYITTPDHALARKVITDLIDSGVAARRIRTFRSTHGSFDDLPIKSLRYRSPASDMMLGTMVGGAVGLLIALALLLFGQVDFALLLVVVVGLAVGGGLFRVWSGYDPGLELYRIGETVQRGEAVVVLNLNSTSTDSVQQRISERFPQVKVLGTDSQGSPPFP